MKTSEIILLESLKLFAIKGYEEVYLSEIAERVGIKAPSLYKHYKSKEDIFNKCVEFFRNKMEEKRVKLMLPKSANELSIYTKKTRDEIIKIAIDLFKFYSVDEVAGNFRKMLLMGRFKDTTLDSIYREVFIDEPLKYQQEVFQYLMDSKRFKKASAEVLAMNFYSPIYFLLQKYDGKENELEMAKHELIQIMNDFCDRCEV